MRTKLFVLGFFLLISGLPIFGQTFGEITGQVVDSTSAAIGGATVTITNTDTNAKRITITTEAGVYSFPSLPPGKYDIRVEKPGFKADTSRQLEVQVQQTVRLDFTLQVGQVSESVEVSAAADQLIQENATLGTVIEHQGIVDLPLNGRNYLGLVALSSNVDVLSP